MTYLWNSVEIHLLFSNDIPYEVSTGSMVSIHPYDLRVDSILSYLLEKESNHPFTLRLTIFTTLDLQCL